METWSGVRLPGVVRGNTKIKGVTQQNQRSRWGFVGSFCPWWLAFWCFATFLMFGTNVHRSFQRDALCSAPKCTYFLGRSGICYLMVSTGCPARSRATLRASSLSKPRQADSKFEGNNENGAWCCWQHRPPDDSTPTHLNNRIIRLCAKGFVSLFLAVPAKSILTTSPKPGP